MSWAAPILGLTCCCCGSFTYGRQWHNRDTGYGLCVKCAAWIGESETPEDMARTYGELGIHYGVDADEVTR